MKWWPCSLMVAAVLTGAGFHLMPRGTGAHAGPMLNDIIHRCALTCITELAACDAASLWSSHDLGTCCHLLYMPWLQTGTAQDHHDARFAACVPKPSADCNALCAGGQLHVAPVPSLHRETLQPARLTHERSDCFDHQHEAPATPSQPHSEHTSDTQPESSPDVAADMQPSAAAWRDWRAAQVSLRSP